MKKDGKNCSKKRSRFWWGEPGDEEKALNRKRWRKYFYLGIIGLVLLIVSFIVPADYSRGLMLFGGGLAVAFLPIGLFVLITGVDPPDPGCA